MTKNGKQREVMRIWRKYPAFKHLQYSTIITSMASWSSFIAMLVLLNQITDSGFALGTLWAVSGLAPLLFSVVVGVWVDRWELQRGLIVVEVLRAVTFLGFIVVPFLPEMYAIGLFLILRFATGIFASFNASAKQAVIPDLVARDDLVVANSLSYTITSVVRLLGASLGGLLLTIFGQEVNWIFASVAYLLSAWLIGREKWSTSKRVQVSKNFKEELTTGLKVAFGNRWILLVLMSGLSGGLVIGSYNLMIEAYSSDVYKIGNWGMSVLYVAEGAVSAYLGYWMANRKFFFKKTSRYGYMYALIGVAWILFGFSGNIYEGVICLVLFAAASAFTAPYERTTMQTEIPEEARGRVFGLWNTISLSALQVGAFLTGAIISLFGLEYVPLLIGSVQVCFGLTFLLVVVNRERQRRRVSGQSMT